MDIKAINDMFERYPAYKDSGVEWLGDIPEGWEAKRLAAFGRFSKGGGFSKSDLADSGVHTVLYGDIYTKYEYNIDKPIRFISKDTAKNSIRIYKGDLLFTGSEETKEDIGKCVLYNADYETYAGGDVIIFKVRQYDSKYLVYALNTEGAKSERAKTAKGEIIVHTYASKLKDIYIPIPPVKEQTAIAHFLDNKTEQIERAIAQKESLINLLKERKQIIIQDLVTGKMVWSDKQQAFVKFSDSDIESKDSGVEWIGEIPKHWEVKRLKYILKEPLKYGANEVGIKYEQNLPRYIRITDFSSEGNLNEEKKLSLPYKKAKEYLLENGDILFARSGATVGKS